MVICSYAKTQTPVWPKMFCGLKRKKQGQIVCCFFFLARPPIDEGEAIEEERDNRNFFANDPSTQKMTTDDIAKMKEEGKVGHELIHEIARNNENFEQKTLFSQKKYLKRKMEKYIARFRILRTNLQNVAETIFLDEPSNIK
jgi:tRNA (adenine-N(1)-)-methyltransferase non-catalytic subunit